MLYNIEMLKERKGAQKKKLSILVDMPLGEWICARPSDLANNQKVLCELRVTLGRTDLHIILFLLILQLLLCK